MTKSSLLPSPILGAHVSIAGGLHHAINQGEQLQCTAIQIFTHSSRQWGFKPLAHDAIKMFIDAQKNSNIETVVVHASYLMNPASPEAANRHKAAALLKLELQACEQLKIPYLVLHPGARLTSDLSDGLRNCAETINTALSTVPGNTKILLENMAGQGSTICSRLEELQGVYNLIEDKSRVGFCFDTCHGFAAGYDFITQATYDAFWRNFDDILGIKKLHVLHMNDSLKPFDAHVDRHADIGKGKIGELAFSLIMNDKRFDHVAKIIETPKGDGLKEDLANLALLRSFITK